MTNITQGQKISEDPTGRSSQRRPGPRRSVLIGAMGSLVAGIVLATTALPAMATVVEPTAGLGSPTTIASTTTTTSVPATTTTTVKHVAKVTPTTQPITTTTVARKRHVARVVTKTTKTTTKPISQASPAPT